MRYSQDVENLCETCKFSYKCARYKKITETLLKLESALFNSYGMDISTGYAVEDCDSYKTNSVSETYTFTFYTEDPPDNFDIE